MIAAFHGRTKIVELLLSQPNIDINFKEILTLEYLLYLNLIFIVEFQFTIIFEIKFNY